jgi:hypothetical protein
MESGKIPNDVFKYISIQRYEEIKKDVKVAEKLFENAGVKKENLCDHGIPFFACMPCSH